MPATRLPRSRARAAVASHCSSFASRTGCRTCRPGSALLVSAVAGSYPDLRDRHRDQRLTSKAIEQTGWSFNPIKLRNRLREVVPPTATDSFTFVFLRDVEAGTVVNFHRQRLAGFWRFPA